MRLTNLSVYNLRSIKKLENIDLSNGLDVFIGQNDSGKSTLLYALDIFFSDKNCQFQDDQNNKNDHSFHSEAHEILGELTIEKDEVGILCRFKLDEEDLNQSRSDLAKLSNGGVLSVLKICTRDNRFDPASGRGSKKPTAFYILKDSFENEDFNEMSRLKEENLIELMEKYPDSQDYLKNLNKKGKPENIERVDALLTYARKSEKSNSKFEKATFDLIKDSIWPQFTLIDTKTSLDGKHKVIEDAFKKIDSKIERKFKDSIDEMKTEAKTEYDRITERIKDYAKKNYIPQIEEFSARPIVKLSVGRDLVMKRIGQKEASHFDLQGDGTKRRMMVAILQTSSLVIEELDADPKLRDTEKTEEYVPLNIWAFDEPELHLHPGAQRDLYNSFHKFKSDGFQIVCSTHSTVFVNSSELDSVHLIQLNEIFESIQLMKNKDIEQIIKQSLGVKNSDVFFSNIFVVVEGSTEQAAFPIIYKHIEKIEIDAAGITLIDGNGWETSKEKIDFLLDNLGNAVCLFDNDVNFAIGKELVEYIETNTIFFIGTADFEDAFSNETWLKVLIQYYNLDIAENTSIWSIEALSALRKEIVPDGKDKNKKFFRLIENYYRRKCNELDVNGNGIHPISFDKKELGVHLANASIELNQIPEPFNSLTSEIRKRLT